MTATDPDLAHLTDPDLEAILARHGLGYTLEWVDIAAVDWEATRAAQIRRGGTDSEFVARYREALTVGRTFRAGFGYYNDDGGIVIPGGQHRAEAHRDHGTTRLPLYVLDPGTVTEKRVRLAAIEHNTSHGLAFTRDELTAQAVDLVNRFGLSQDAAGKVVGLSRVTVNRACIAAEAGARAQRLAVTDVWGSFGKTIRATCAAACGRFDDAVFEDMVATMANTGVTIKLAKELARRLDEADDDQAAFAVLSDFEAAYLGGDLDDARASGPMSAAQFRTLLAKVLDVDPGHVADTCGESFDEATVSLCERAVHRIAEAAAKINTTRAGKPAAA